MAPRQKTKGKQRAKAGRRKTSRGRTRANASAERQIPITARDRLAGQWFTKLVALQARLRAPNGCPWDREQTHESLRKFLVEETYEVLDAMESGDAAGFSSELGDLLLQTIFHSIIAEETGRFTMAEVIESVHSKMIRRHTHVFGDATAKTSGEVLRNWEQIKVSERAAKQAGGSGANRTAKNSSEGAESILGGVPRSLPAVLEAYQLTRRASHVGFDWDDLSGTFDKLDEEARELRAAFAGSGSFGSPSLRVEEEMGDLLLAAVNVARFLGVDPEIALKKANGKFKRRFQGMEAAAAREGRSFADLSRARKEELWNSLKAGETSAASAAQEGRGR